MLIIIYTNQPSSLAQPAWNCNFGLLIEQPLSDIATYTATNVDNYNHNKITQQEINWYMQ